MRGGAWAEWRHRDRLERDWSRRLAAIERDIEFIADAMCSDLAHELAENPHYRKVVDRFFGRTREGWEVACGSDRGLWKKTRTLPVERLLGVVALSKRLRD